MAVSLRERPFINGKDADRLKKKIMTNNEKHQKLIERMVAEQTHVQNARFKSK